LTLAAAGHRAQDVLDLLAAARNSELIAEQLVLSVKTVRNYVSNIMSKLQVADRAQAIVRARQAGFGETKPEVRQ
jgi:DNA-binding NarL/FixJ family response regulator